MKDLYAVKILIRDSGQLYGYLVDEGVRYFSKQKANKLAKKFNKEFTEYQYQVIEVEIE